MLVYLAIGALITLGFVAEKLYRNLSAVSDLVGAVRHNGVLLRVNDAAPARTTSDVVTEAVKAKIQALPGVITVGWFSWLWNWISPMKNWQRVATAACGLLLGIVFFSRKRTNPVKESLRREKYTIVLRVLAALTVLVNYDVYVDIVKALQLHLLLRSVFAYFAPPPKVDKILGVGFVQGPTLVPSVVDTAAVVATTATTPLAAAASAGTGFTDYPGVRFSAQSDADLLAQAKAKASETWDVAKHQPIEVDGKSIFSEDDKLDSLSWAVAARRVWNAISNAWKAAQVELCLFLACLVVGCAIGWLIMYWSARSRLLKKVKKHLRAQKRAKEASPVIQVEGVRTSPYDYSKSLDLSFSLPNAQPEARTTTNKRTKVDYDNDEDAGITSKRDIMLRDENGELVTGRLNGKQVRLARSGKGFMVEPGQFVPVSGRLWADEQEGDPGEWHPESAETLKKYVESIDKKLTELQKATTKVEPTPPKPVKKTGADVDKKKKRNRHKPAEPVSALKTEAKVSVCYVCGKTGKEHGRGPRGWKWCASQAKLEVTKEAAIKGSSQFDVYDVKRVLLKVTDVNDTAEGEGFCVGNDFYTAWHVVDPSEKLENVDGILHRDGKTLRATFRRLGSDIAVAKGVKATSKDFFEFMQSIGFSPYVFFSGAQCRIYSIVYKSFQGDIVSVQDKDRQDVGALVSGCPKYCTYGMSTYKGMSGCPIFVDGHLVAVHVESVPGRQMNRAELLAPHLNL